MMRRLFVVAVGVLSPLVAAVVSPLAAAGIVVLTAVRLSGARGTSLPGSSSTVAFTPAVALGSGLLATTAAWFGHRRSAAVMAASAAALGAVVLPRTRPKAQPAIPAGDGVELRFLSANCLKGAADPKALMTLIREVQPDVVALQEQNRHLLRLLELEGLSEVLPYRVLSPGGRMCDAGLLSRHPLTPIAPELSGVFAAAEATLPGGRRLPLIAFHPLPPVGTDYTARWSDAVEEVPSPEGVFEGAILGGDFNASLDHPEFRALLRCGWRDAARECGGALRATWSEFGLLRLTIDHILVSGGMAVSNYRVHRLAGSDHRAISATITLPPLATPARVAS